jgi:serine/threonine protein kinase
MALGYAHANGLVHRDVKPSNLYLLNRDFRQVCLLDFGIARQRDNPSGLTSRGTVVGTPAYMAPEQARGSLDIDGRADVFALGCILFRGLTGRQPFEGAHRMAVLAKIVFESAPHVFELRPDVPRALDDLVDRMLAKNPDDRPPDGDAVAEELR